MVNKKQLKLFALNSLFHFSAVEKFNYKRFILCKSSVSVYVLSLVEINQKIVFRKEISVFQDFVSCDL